jgi:DNA-binding beta-propeller fold protein YncE
MCGLGLMLTTTSAPAGWFSHEPEYRSPQVAAVDAKGQTLYVAEGGMRDLAVMDLARTQVTRRISLPDTPSGLAFSPEQFQLYVTCSAPKSTVVVVDTLHGRVLAKIPAGHTATGPSVSPDGRWLYVCYRFDGMLGVIDLLTRSESARIPVPREPISSAVTADGKHVLVAHHLHAGRSDVDYVACSVSVVNTASGKVVKELKLPNGSTLLRDIRVSPDGKIAAVAHTLARFQLPTTQLDRGWMNTSAITLIDLATLEVMNTFLLDDVDRGAANPWGLAWTADGKKLCVSHAGTHELSVIDFPGVLAKLAKARPEDVPNDLAFLVDLRDRIPVGGTGPRGIAIAGDKVYTANHFSDDVTVVDLAGERAQVAQLALGSVIPVTPERQGERWFNDASICFQQWQSCASCHSEDARVDALNWDLLNDGIGNPKNNRSMLYTHVTPPAMSLGVRDSAEMAVRAGIRFIQFTVQPPEVAEAIDAYLKALRPVPSPHLVNGRPSPAAKRGKAVFERAACNTCHSGPLYTDLQQYDFGTTKGMDADKALDTPTLIESWRTAPYLFDGSAATMRDALTGHPSPPPKLTDAELNDLCEFVLSL